ncbi:hypothetical protein Tco_0431580 [Tanacetum coccineum]
MLIAPHSCYHASLITADVLELYMHQFWNYVYKHDTFYRFKIDNKKRFKLTLEVFRDIFHILPRVPVVENFDALPSEEDPTKNVDYVESLQGDIIYQIENRSTRRKKKSQQMRKRKRTNLTGYATGALPPKIAKKLQEEPLHQEGHDWSMKKETQMKEVRKKSLRDFHKIHPSGSGTIVKKPQSVDKITPAITSKGTGDKPGFRIITTLEKEVVELKKDPLHTQVTTLVDEHLDTQLGETREEFMIFLSESLTTRIKEKVKDQLPQILPKEVSNFAPPVIKELIKESRDKVNLAKVSSQPHSTYEAASTLTEFELKKTFLDKIEKNFFFSYDVYSLKRRRKDKDEDPFAGSDQGLKKRKLSKDAEPTTSPKKKDSTSGSSKGTKSQLKSFGKFVQSEEPVFDVADSDLPQDQEGNLGDNEYEPRDETASRRD